MQVRAEDKVRECFFKRYASTASDRQQQLPVKDLTSMNGRMQMY